MSKPPDRGANLNGSPLEGKLAEYTGTDPFAHETSRCFPEIGTIQLGNQRLDPRARLAYDYRAISVVTIKDRKIVGWRDYMESPAAMTALGVCTGGIDFTRQATLLNCVT